VIELGEATRDALRRILPREAGFSNPIDMIASATPDQYAQTLNLLLADDDVDALIVIFIPPLVTQATDVAHAISEALSQASRSKTVLACFMSTRGAPEELAVGANAVPSYIFPEAAAAALARVAGYAEWRKRPRGQIPTIDRDLAAARIVIDDVLEQSGDETAWLTIPECQSILRAYGIRTVPMEVATSAHKAAEAARRLGTPVAIKLASATITHKTDVGGVILGVTSLAGVGRAFQQIRERLAALGKLDEMDGVVVQPMVEAGVETIIGVTQDRAFGPLVMFGLGGTLAELMKDVQVRVQPVTDVDAREMIRSVNGYPLLEGWRGSSAADIGALQEVILRVSAMSEDLPEILEMDLNPVRALALGEGAIVVDARMLVQRRSSGQ
jgi:acyl-CoA synthetase (NDP forming)